MSVYLLDTNILIAILNDTVSKLPLRIRGLLADRSAKLSVSVVSPWEVSIKRAAGKLELVRPKESIGKRIGEFGLPILPITIDHALEVAHPEPATKDPFDRLLLAVCACEGMKLVTTDNALLGHRLVF